MKSGVLSSTAQLSLLQVALFFLLIFSLFLLITLFGSHRDRKKEELNVALFLALFGLLVVLANDFERINQGLAPWVWQLVPAPVFWCAAVGAALLLFREMAGLRRAKGQMLTRNSVKEAMDLLPSGICYFTTSGSVKLCNLQMYRLFRSLAQKDL